MEQREPRPNKNHYVIYGAGGVGCVVGARLHQAGHAVSLIARGAHRQALISRGLRLISPAGVDELQLPVFEHPAAVTFEATTVVLLCMKSQHTKQALTDLAAVAPPTTPVVCMQNGVGNERHAKALFANTYAAVVILPALFLEPGEVVTHADNCGGVLDCGSFPVGVDGTAERIAADLTQAGFSAKADPEVMRLKYAKLLSNLANIVQAALPGAAVPGTLARPLRAEALACYQAAGIACATSAEMRARQALLTMSDIDGHPRAGGSTWQSLARGAVDLETDYLNGEIVRLGLHHGVPTPANQVMVEVAGEIMRGRLSPGAFTEAALLDRIEHRQLGRS